MTVYTDGVHLITDQADDAELHILAGKIRLMRRWYQRDHYDLTTRKAAERAVDAGAVLVDMRDLVRLRLLIRERRGTDADRRRSITAARFGVGPDWRPTPLDPSRAADQNTALLRMFSPGKRIGIRGGDHL